MKVLSNPHTHTDYVDGKSSAREQIEQALKLGFEALGFSEHAIQPNDPRYGLKEEDIPRYIAEINALKAEYAGRINIWLGLERDALSTDDYRNEYDYILGAAHYIQLPDGDWMEVDSDAEGQESFVNRRFGGSWDKELEMYFDMYATYLEQLKPDIIAHFDLVVKQNRTRHWFDETGGTFLSCGREAMRRAIKVCDVLEVNTGGMVRSNQPCPYPVMPLLKYWRELGGRVIPSSDCHRSYQLDAAFDTVLDYIKEAGYDSFLTLGTGDKLFETRPLR